MKYNYFFQQVSKVLALLLTFSAITFSKNSNAQSNSRIIYPLDPFTLVNAQFTNFDYDKDSIVEIEYIKNLNFETTQDKILNLDAKTIIVFVEPRVLNPKPNETDSKLLEQKKLLLQKLERMKGDLEQEGYKAKFVEMKVYSGNLHQDGKTVLAMREYLKKVKSVYTNLTGAILVGSFPESSIVRNWIWKIPNGTINIKDKTYTNVDWLHIVPHFVAARTDIILGDLDGNWDKLYNQNQELEIIRAVPTSDTPEWPVKGNAFKSNAFLYEKQTFSDFFYVNDSNYKIINKTDNEITVELDPQMQNLEISENDKLLDNKLAIPELMISRINPRHIGVNPYPYFQDKNGNNYLDKDGKPQTVTASSEQPLDPYTFWARDEKKELELLLNFLDRNHSFRIGGMGANPFQGGVVTSRDFPSYWYDYYVKQFSNEFGDNQNASEANLLEYVEWLKKPITLRLMAGHSDRWATWFPGNYSLSDLVSSTGTPWRWSKYIDGQNFIYSPSFQEQGELSEFHLHKTIYENKKLPKSASFYIIGGCDVNIPDYFDYVPYNTEYYGTFNSAESTLFHLNGLALVARAKGFYDFPECFTSEIGNSDSKNFGDGLRAYYSCDSKNVPLQSMPADNKKSYPWSILGDWTLRKKYSNGLALFNGNQDLAHLSFGNKEIYNVSDINANGKDEIAYQDGNTIHIIEFNGQRWIEISNLSMTDENSKLVGTYANEIIIQNLNSLNFYKLNGSILIKSAQYRGLPSPVISLKYLGNIKIDGDLASRIIIQDQNYVKVLKRNNNIFSEISQINSYDSLIYKGDIDGDRKDEILLISNSLLKIAKFVKTKFQIINEIPYTSGRIINLLDVNNDGKLEIIRVGNDNNLYFDKIVSNRFIDNIYKLENSEDINSIQSITINGNVNLYFSNKSKLYSLTFIADSASENKFSLTDVSNKINDWNFNINSKLKFSGKFTSPDKQSLVISQ